MSELEDRHYLGSGGETLPDAREALEWAAETRVFDALETDHEFLLRGGVFTEDLIRTWIDWKREHEVDVVRLRPHPAEFGLYYDC